MTILEEQLLLRRSDLNERRKGAIAFLLTRPQWRLQWECMIKQGTLEKGGF